MKRIEWIDGFKGILCIGVFAHHFLLVFYPTVYTGDINTSHNVIDIFLSKEPISVIHNGNFFVCCFLIISAILVANKAKGITVKETISIIVKRYFTLCLVFLFINIATYILIKIGLYNNADICSKITGTFWLEKYSSSEINIFYAFIEAFFVTPIIGGSSFGGHFWMMNYIFLGTVLICFVSLIEKKNKIVASVITAILILIFAVCDNYLICYLIGYLLATIDRSIKSNKMLLLSAFFFIFIGIFLGSFPSGKLPTEYFLVRLDLFLNYFPFKINKVSFVHEIAATFLIFGLIVIKNKLIFSEKIKKIGKLCLSVFLLNEIIIYCVSANVFVIFINLGVQYDLAVIITFIFSIISMLMSAYILNKYIVSSINRIVDKIIKRINENESICCRG